MVEALKHIPGAACQCAATGQNECCCDSVDWRSTREVELESLYASERQSADALAEALEANKAMAYHFGDVHENGVQPDYELITRAGTLTHAALAAHEKRRAA